jgi:hypothetical protein
VSTTDPNTQGFNGGNGAPGCIIFTAFV